MKLKEKLKQTMKTVKYGKYTISYNLERLLHTCTFDINWIAEDQLVFGDIHEEMDFRMTEEEFNKAKENFIKNVEDIEASFEDVLKSKVTLTKKGTLHAGRNHIILESGISKNPELWTGNWSYLEPCLRVVETGEDTAEIVLTDIKRSQST